MVTTAGITRLIRSSSESDAAASTGGTSVSGVFAVRSTGAPPPGGAGASGGTTAGETPAPSEVVDADIVTGRDTAACLLFIHHTAPENAASATTSNPAAWRRIEGPAPALECAAASESAGTAPIAASPHRHFVSAWGTRRPHTEHTHVVEPIDPFSVGSPVLSTTKDTKESKGVKSLDLPSQSQIKP